jgi:Uma2 family endonuclease
MSVSDYHRAGEVGVLGKDVELLRGIVVKKMPKSPLHELVCQKLMLILLAKVPKEFQVRRESPLTLPDSEPEPDISVVRGKPDDWAKAHPGTANLVVEVAVSSVALDEGMGEIYEEVGIPEYWLVGPEARALDVYRDPTRSGYRSKIIFAENDVLQSESIAGLSITVAEILPARS